MKKLLVVVAVITAVFANAQSSKREEGIKFGLKGGLNVANMYGDIEENTFRTSLHIGVVSEIIVNDNFSIQPELLFSGQGYSDEGFNGYSRYKLNYVNLPVMMKYYVADRLSIEAGPQLGVLVSGKHKTDLSNDDVENLNTVDFSVCAGAGYELESGVFFQLRYNLGITNVYEAKNPVVEYSNGVFQASIGILF